MKKKILVICPTKQDIYELTNTGLTDNYSFIFQEYDETAYERIIAGRHGGDFEKESASVLLDKLVELAQNNAVDAVVSSDDYPGSIFASIIAHELGLIGPRPAALLMNQHKYYGRKVQQKVAPEATPAFALINPHDFNVSDFSLPFPVFIKPVKSYLSIGAGMVSVAGHLASFIKKAMMPEGFFYHFDWFLRNYAGVELGGNYLIAEELLQGHQVTFEGYVYQGQVHSIGVVDSIMYPGTRSFERFVYPSTLSQRVKERMATIAQRVAMATGLDNTLFNIEFMYNPEKDAVHIIEVNPRMANQFADLYEKVDGTNTYHILLDLALGKKPVYERGNGKYAMAASLVLRTFQDKRVTKVPIPEEIQQFLTQLPDGRFYPYAKEGELLSYEVQDGHSFRYGLLHLGGQNTQDIDQKRDQALAILKFSFETI